MLRLPETDTLRGGWIIDTPGSGRSGSPTSSRGT